MITLKLTTTDGEELMEVDENIQSLDLSFRQIKILSEIDKLTKLVDLDLSNNYLDEMPELNINITHLCLFNNQIKQLPREINKLINLRELYLSGNQNIDISNMEIMPELTHLDLSDVKLTSAIVQSKFKAFPNLKCLDLSNNKLTQMPDTNVMRLILSGNQIKNDSSQNINMLELYLECNEIKHYNNTFINLSHLNLSNNLIKKISNINTLKNLTYLYLSKNQLQLLPDISELINLRILSCNNNYIKYISAEINKLEKLNRIDLSNNPIKFLPLLRMEKINILNTEIIYSHKLIINLIYDNLLFNKDI